MVDRTSLTRVGESPRTATGREWEVFVREQESAPLRAVGSVTAPTPDAAYDLASDLFAWHATELWLCPADEVVRYADHDLDDAVHGNGRTDVGDDAATTEP